MTIPNFCNGSMALPKHNDTPDQPPQAVGAWCLQHINDATDYTYIKRERERDASVHTLRERERERETEREGESETETLTLLVQIMPPSSVWLVVGACWPGSKT